MSCQYSGFCPHQSSTGRGRPICSRALRSEEDIVGDYLAGMSIRKIKRKYHVSSDTLCEIPRRHDVKLRGGFG